MQLAQARADGNKMGVAGNTGGRGAREAAVVLLPQDLAGLLPLFNGLRLLMA